MQVGADGLTPFEMAHGRRMGRPLRTFGEQVLDKPAAVGRSKAAKMGVKFSDGASWA